MSGDLLNRLAAAGTPLDLIMEVAEALAEARAAERLLEKRRAADRERKPVKNPRIPRNSEEYAEIQGSQGNGFLDKESPQTPKKIILPRDLDSSPAREALQVLSEVIDALVADHLKRWKNLPPPPAVSDEQWTGFLEHRKAHPKGGKFTAYAYKLLCRKLAELAEDGWPPGEMIDLAIERRWITVFAPKDFQHGRTNGMGRNQPDDGLGRTARAALEVFGPDPRHAH